ncbi:hypothetical protein OG948_02965 [Embleya sp. NBC_00888]|uniref:hypothetical protein n=1 Tax=Embleya sp. NBC_00888 TaxID=2975960 RepID=UPI00386FC8B1|nr:hypothetical protein OG948_02965 [Embleya sp. NBC_00888]
MGYWGYVVIAKGDHTLAEHPAVAAFGSGVLDDYPRGSWREIQMYSRPRDDADIAAVVAATGAPAMAFYVADGDCAVGEGAAPSGHRWDGVLTEVCVLSDYPDALPTGYRRDNAVAGAIAWAAEAGLTADPTKIEQAFARGSLDNLYDAVGLPGIVYTE